MATNIVFCIDGTGNTPTTGGGGTNVFRLYNAVDINSHKSIDGVTRQVAYYDEGVGTEHSRIVRTFSRATGKGIAHKIRRLYTQLVMVYQPGDRLFFFGFSRGAYAIRHMVSIIATCGIVDSSAHPTLEAVEAAIDEKIRTYWRMHYGRMPPQTRDGYRPFQAVVDFIGVWDTVDSVGVPFPLPRRLRRRLYPFANVDNVPAMRIAHACQCLAMDEERRSFSPVLWSTHFGAFDADRVEQVWFPGVHSNVGGGYERNGLSFVSLDWMMTRAREHGLRFYPTDIEPIREHQSYNDRLYDSRAGLGRLYRWGPRNIAALSARHGIHSPSIHVSALQRILNYTDFYAPANVPPAFTLVEEDHVTTRPVALDSLTGGACSKTHASGRQLVTFGSVAHIAQLLALATLVALVVALFVDERSFADAFTRPIQASIVVASMVAMGAALVSGWFVRRRRRLYLNFWLRHRTALISALRPLQPVDALVGPTHDPAGPAAATRGPGASL